MNRQERRKLAQSTAKTQKSKTGEKIDLSKFRAKTNGEVFTPPILAEKMLDKLTPDSFTNRDLTFLDPCFGATAVFPIMLMFRLADGLRDVITDPSARIKHIVENMLYMAEKDEDACNFGQAGIQHYAKLLVRHLSFYDSPVAVSYVRNGYIENYDNIINTFYESIKKKSA